MEEKKYEVLDYATGDSMIRDTSFENAIVFIRGYVTTYYNKRLNLVIKEQASGKQDINYAD